MSSEDLPTIVSTKAAAKRKAVANQIWQASMRLFKNMNIPTELLDVDPAQWESSEYYKAAVRRVNGMIVVNDFAGLVVTQIQVYEQSINQSLNKSINK